MEKLVEECKLDCPEEKQIQILEKCLPLVRVDRDVQSKSMGWLLLARILERCSPQCLRAAHSRLGKKLVDVKNEPTIHGGIFVRQLLFRNPQVGNLYAEVVHDIITRFIDQTVDSGDQTLRKLVIELYSIHYGCDAQMSEILLNTLSAVIEKRLLSQEERAGVLQLQSFGVSSLRDDLCSLLFDMYSSSLCFAKAGQYVQRDTVVNVLETGLDDLKLRDAAFGTIRSLCTNGSSAFLPLVPKVVIILVSKLAAPSAALFQTMTHICRIYGPASTLFRHFYVIYRSLKHPLDKEEYGPYAGRLLSAVIQTSSFLIKPEVLMSVQRKICEEVVLNTNSSVYLDVLTSFLSCTHELVSPPVHIARTVIRRCYGTTDLQAVNSLCDLLTRPRMQNLASYEIVRRSLAKLERDAVDDADVIEPGATADASAFRASLEFEEKICKVIGESVGQNADIEKPPVNQETSSIEQKIIVEKPSTSQEIASTSAAPVPCNVGDEILDISVGSKRNIAKETEFLADVAEKIEQPSAKKAKNLDQQLQDSVKETKLLDGELTVDEILSMFCPD